TVASFLKDAELFSAASTLDYDYENKRHPKYRIGLWKKLILRSFTLKEVEELMEKTGVVCSFWMDHFKWWRHCYLMVGSRSEAKAGANIKENKEKKAKK
ncbi:hypothetical protein MKX01_028937, partial [Papaver californicum]